MAGEPHPAWVSGVSTGEQIGRFRAGFTRFTADSPLSIPQSAKLRRVTKVDENSSQGHRQDQVLVASQRPPSTPRCPSSRRHKWLQCRDTGRSVTGHQRASSARSGHSRSPRTFPVSSRPRQHGQVANLHKVASLMQINCGPCVRSTTGVHAELRAPRKDRDGAVPRQIGALRRAEAWCFTREHSGVQD